MSLLCRKAVRSCSCRYGPGLRTKRSARSSKRQRKIIAKHCANLREWSDWVERHGRRSREGSGRVERERARYNGATGVSDMAEGWDHDRGGVFSGRAQRENAEIQRHA